MKKFIEATAFMLLPWLCCFAGLGGTVTDAVTKEKVQGAVITVENSFLVAITDAQGKFSFPKMGDHSAKITVSHLGYEILSREISLQDENVEISLQPQTYLTEEIT